MLDDVVDTMDGGRGRQCWGQMIYSKGKEHALIRLVRELHDVVARNYGKIISKS